MKEKLLVSVSGGETSAMMAYVLNSSYADKYDMIFVFANTSREREETLRFVRDMERHWGINIVWVEAVVHHGQRKSCTHRVVDFDTAKRDGEVFTECIRKYYIPSTTNRSCTRELKRNAIKSYARSIGWKKYRLAIGFRADEPKRLNWEKEKTEGHLYILPRLGIKKADVKRFMAQQPFQLGLKSYEGNCRLCFKKSRRKLLTQLLGDPQAAEWVNEMEIQFERHFPKGYTLDKPFRFFRGGESIQDLIADSKLPFEVFVDADFKLSDFDIELDEEEECSESCEVY